MVKSQLYLNLCSFLPQVVTVRIDEFDELQEDSTIDESSISIVQVGVPYNAYGGEPTTLYAEMELF